MLSILHQSAAADTFGSGASSFDIKFVTIGDPGNAADTTGYPNPAGSVPYSYRMGKFEISEQMIDKANAEGGLGITRDTRGPNRPATSVSWNEAARFVNWLNISTGNPPAYNFEFQPGEVGYIPYGHIDLWTIGDAGYNPNNLFRNSLARYFLPSIDEWYKAAFYDPSANGGAGGYWDYPTGSDTPPTPVASGTAVGSVVYDLPFEAVPADIALAGGLSPYGTMGQAGNVWEMGETDSDLMNDDFGSARLVRGSNWSLPFDGSEYLSSSVSITSGGPADKSVTIGFRVASIPEPSTLLLLCFGSLAVLWRRRALSLPQRGARQ